MSQSEHLARCFTSVPRFVIFIQPHCNPREWTQKHRASDMPEVTQLHVISNWTKTQI